MFFDLVQTRNSVGEGLRRYLHRHLLMGTYVGMNRLSIRRNVFVEAVDDQLDIRS